MHIHNQARSLLQARQISEAEALLTEHLSSVNGDSESCFLLGIAKGMLGKHQEAQAALYKALEHQPNHLEARFNLAISMQSSGDKQGAAAELRKLIASEPNHIGALVTLANYELNEQRVDTAKPLIDKALSLAPTNVQVIITAANTLRLMNNLAAAVNLYDQVLAHEPSNIIALFNKALALKANKQIHDAIDILTRLLDIKPDIPDAYYCLGCCHLSSSNKSAAENAFKTALELNPSYIEAAMQLANLLRYRNALQQATAIYDQVLSIDPNNLEAAFYRDATSQPDTIHRIPANVARATYNHNDSASNFDATLREHLDYHVPARLSKLLPPLIDTNIDKVRALELGCGSGLGGEAIREHVDELTGVDVSSNMLDFVRQKNIYTELIEDDLEEYLRDSASKFSLVLALDVLCFFGDLTDIFQSIHAKLLPNGLLAFTVEKTNTNKDFEFFHYGHFLHSEAYLKQALQAAGFKEILFEEGALRTELNESRIGFLCIFQRSN